MSGRGARAIVYACAAVLLLFVAGRLLVPVDETDLFFNLRLGEIVLHDHTVPRTNLLSFTYPDYRDVNLAWLFQIVLALAHRAGGVPGTLLLKVAFVLATLAVLFRVALRRGAHPAAATLALALSAWAAEPRFVERPHLVTFLGLALTLLALERAESREGSGTLPGFPNQSTGKPRALYALIPCGLVWANANSCFFEASLVLALYALGARLDRRRPDARRAALCAAALVPLIFATPSGVHALGYLANHWRMPSLRPLEEYVPARWPDNAPALFVAVGVVAAAVIPGRRWRHLLPVAFLGLVGACRNRFLAEYALLAGPVVARAVTDVVARATTWLSEGPRQAARRIATVAVVALLAGAAIVPRVSAAFRGERFDLGLDPTLIPQAAIAFATENGLRDRMYNDMEVGSYLTWEGWPRHRVFQDPRINGYPRAFHALLRRADVSRAEWENAMASFGVTTALLTYPTQNPRAAFFDSDLWALVYRADDGLVFVRRRPQFAALIARAELPIRFFADDDRRVRPYPIHGRPAASPLRDCEWKRRLGDFFVESFEDHNAIAAYRVARSMPDCLDAAGAVAAGMALGDAALRRHDPAIAVDAYAGIDLPRAHTNRALAFLGLGRSEEAIAEARAVLSVDPENADARTAERLAKEQLARMHPPPMGR